MDEFDIKDIILINGPIMGNINISVTSIVIYLILSTIIVYAFLVLRCNKGYQYRFYYSKRLIFSYISLLKKTIYDINGIVISQIKNSENNPSIRIKGKFLRERIVLKSGLPFNLLFTLLIISIYKEINIYLPDYITDIPFYILTLCCSLSMYNYFTNFNRYIPLNVDSFIGNGTHINLDINISFINHPLYDKFSNMLSTMLDNNALFTGLSSFIKSYQNFSYPCFPDIYSSCLNLILNNKIPFILAICHNIGYHIYLEHKFYVNNKKHECSLKNFEYPRHEYADVGNIGEEPIEYDSYIEPEYPTHKSVHVGNIGEEPIEYDSYHIGEEPIEYDSYIESEYPSHKPKYIYNDSNFMDKLHDEYILSNLPENLSFGVHYNRFNIYNFNA